MRGWYRKDITTFGGSKVDMATSQFSQIIKERMHILSNLASCIDLIFASQPNLVTHYGVHRSLHSFTIKLSAQNWTSQLFISNLQTISLALRQIWILFIKVAHVVNLKLVFVDWFLYNLVILIKLCKIRYLN